mmetsp:Transcript_12843/g.30603  ORF Transcript_12843/g.30603 Transcript_12843/m.30603 type:complete len:432 (-) Transcript_12843:311-1606(-)
MPHSYLSLFAVLMTATAHALCAPPHLARVAPSPWCSRPLARPVALSAPSLTHRVALPRATRCAMCALDYSEQSAVSPVTPPASPPPRPRFSIKYVVLVLLVVQNSAVTLMVRRTRTAAANGGPLYIGAMAVLVSELLKLPTCLALIAREEGSVRAMVRAVYRGVFVRWMDSLRVGVPALCYGLQNALFFVALSNLPASSYQLWSQSKTLFTAFFFVTILKKSLQPRQWLALALLTGGVGLVQLQESSGAAAIAGGVPMLGVAAVLASSLLSGFANIYFEKVLKQSDCEREDNCEVEGATKTPASLWLRNVQLSMFAIPQAAGMVLCTPKSRALISSHGALVGFTPAVWAVTFLTAGGGLLIAAVVKHADNLLKTYATAVAIVLTCCITSITTGVAPTPAFLQGMTLVLSSIFLYNTNLKLRLPRLPRRSNR